MSKEGFFSAIVTSRGVDIPLKTSRWVIHLFIGVDCAIL